MILTRYSQLLERVEVVRLNGRLVLEKEIPVMINEAEIAKSRDDDQR